MIGLSGLLTLALLSTDPVLVGRTPVELAAGRDPGRRSSVAAYEAARKDARFALERLSYRSDGLRVTAFLYAPRGAERGRPAVVFLRGGYLSTTPVEELLPLFHDLAVGGYTVIAPQLRQSDGGEGTDEVGGADLDDVLVVPTLLREVGGVDTSRLYLLGESRGGMMAYQAIRDGFPARAAAVYGAFTDLAALFVEHPEQYVGLAHRLWPDFEARKAEIFGRRSALSWPEKLTIPLLILHGGADTTIDVSHARRLAGRLQELGRPHELHVIEGDGHTLTDHQDERNRLVLAWFDRHR